MTYEELKDFLDEKTIWNYMEDVSNAPAIRTFPQLVNGKEAPVDYIDKEQFSFDNGFMPNIDQPRLHREFSCIIL